MKTILHKSSTRGETAIDWLKSYHSFSFAQYYDPERMHFGALRVLNDDTVSPGRGFGIHPHKNMEIVSIPLKGILQHGDNIDHSRFVTPGEIQTMSAGTGIYHSEVNGSNIEPVEFLQIWVVPQKDNTPPRYQDFDVRYLKKKNEPYAIISPDGSTPASLLQNCWFSLLDLDKDKQTSYALHAKENGVYIFLLEGKIGVADYVLNRRDAIGVYDTDYVDISGQENSHALLIEVPMY